MSIFDSLVHQKDEYDRKSLEMLENYIRQLDSRSGKEIPDQASRDLLYILGLQRTRWKNREADIHTRYEITPESFRFVNWKMDTDRYYKVRIPFFELDSEIDYFFHGRNCKSVREKQTIYAYAVWLREQRENISYCCPNCGAVSTVEQLLSGCSYCGTKFLMTDLYPKISSVYTKKELDIERHVKRDTLVVAFCMITFAFLWNFFHGNYETIHPVGLIFSMVVTVVVSLGFGWMISNLTVGFRKIGQLFVFSGFQRKMIQSGKILRDFMSQYEPEFSLDYMVTKLVYLTRVMLYTEQYDNCAVYDGNPLVNQWTDIIDARYRGFYKLRKCYEENDRVYLDISIGMNNVYISGDGIQNKNEQFRLLIRKKALVKTDYGFSIHAIQCFSCGGSFDATREKHCPYCGNGYSIDNFDWVVEEFNRLD